MYNIVLNLALALPAVLWHNDIYSNRLLYLPNASAEHLKIRCLTKAGINNKIMQSIQLRVPKREDIEIHSPFLQGEQHAKYDLTVISPLTFAFHCIVSRTCLLLGGEGLLSPGLPYPMRQTDKRYGCYSCLKGISQVFTQCLAMNKTLTYR